MSQCDMLREHESCMSLLLNFMVNYKIEAEGDEAGDSPSHKRSCMSCSSAWLSSLRL